MSQVVLSRFTKVIVDLAVSVFGFAWTSSLQVADRQIYAAVGDKQNDLRHEILGELSQGKREEQIARRLGLSVRTCRRHIAAIMDEFGATSRFQAGLLAAEQKMVGPTEFI